MLDWLGCHLVLVANQMAPSLEDFLRLQEVQADSLEQLQPWVLDWMMQQEQQELPLHLFARQVHQLQVLMSLPMNSQLERLVQVFYGQVLPCGVSLHEMPHVQQKLNFPIVLMQS